ncbi:hypothetical protein [Algihabitans albus]|uniref:hypothetical protein n=1 Tax=Algihabitans albus TaxID=2164067 RepID=UPI0013C32547|nr:hypothetical protein [Algihabitans albus]
MKIRREGRSSNDVDFNDVDFNDAGFIDDRGTVFSGLGRAPDAAARRIRRTVGQSMWLGALDKLRQA